MRNPRRRRLVIINSALALLIVAGGIGAYLALRSPAKAESKAGVRTVAVAKGNVSATISASGTVTAAKILNVDFTAAGKISDVKVKAGQVVKAGDVLATLDTKVLEQNSNAAWAAVTSAKADLTAAQTATKVDASQVARAQSSLVSAQAKAEQADDALDSSTLKAPSAGTLLAVNAEVGGSSSGGGTKTASTGTNAGTPLFQLTDLTNLQVRAVFTEADSLKVQVGQAVTVALNAAPGKPAPGKVAVVDPTPTTQNSVVTYGVTVTFDQLPAEVRLGQSASITVVTGAKEGVLVVPTSAVRGSGNRASVTVVDAAGAQSAKPVQLGLQGDLYTEVTGGLAEGERIVLATTGGANPQPTTQRGTGRTR
ncbi:hemolysin secretion protein D [Longispora fulva]|uniref:Macrolide-specific efflux system membrane fusion protein n=1 Tax=Longispora fulva TaxID=619741 RepID=A0A8J7GLG8_9ACTN|nr:efflux RND transporter periplasmic adaptor subunit [Longispora fulva]MBG6139117.1 macrolide-specific efflux system membrane fusion protein [Longispora fulva]GIG58609.1 hemolysin secretion protein D [Longispora fulva]